MKSERLPPSEFWSWFVENAAAIASEAHPHLLDVLDEKLRQVNPRLSWEIGPGRVEAWQLAVSPNLDKDLAQDAREMVAAAPKLQGWEFYATRQPKQWDYRVELSGEGNVLTLDASHWKFVLLRYPDGFREVLLASSELPPLTDDQRWQAAAIFLEGILGEDALMVKIDKFDLVTKLEPQFEAKLRPISGLRGAIA